MILLTIGMSCPLAFPTLPLGVSLADAQIPNNGYLQRSRDILYYGFIYRNDPLFPLDDANWFLLKK